MKATLELPQCTEASPDEPRSVIENGPRNLTTNTTYGWSRRARPGLRTTTLVTGHGTRSAAAAAGAMAAAGQRVVLAMSLPGVQTAHATRASTCFFLPQASDPNYVSAVLAIARRVGARIVVPTGESDIVAITRAKQRFDDTGLRILAPDADTLEIFRDRSRLLRTLAGVVPVPLSRRRLPEDHFETWVVRSRDSLLGGPSRFAAVDESVEEEELCLEYLPGEEIWVDVSRRPDGSTDAGAARRVQRTGRPQLLERPADAGVLKRLARVAAVAVELVGHATVRFRRDAIGFPLVVDMMPGFVSTAHDERGSLGDLVSHVLNEAVEAAVGA